MAGKKTNTGELRVASARSHPDRRVIVKIGNAYHDVLEVWPDGGGKAGDGLYLEIDPEAFIVRR